MIQTWERAWNFTVEVGHEFFQHSSLVARHGLLVRSQNCMDALHLLAGLFHGSQLSGGLRLSMARFDVHQSGLLLRHTPDYLHDGVRGHRFVEACEASGFS